MKKRFKEINKIRLCFFAAFLMIPFFTGAEEKASPIINVSYAKDPIIVDGNLKEEVWKNSQIYELEDRNEDVKGRPVEKGFCQFAWNKEYFYLAVKFYDSDIVAEGEKDQLHHYKMGDLASFFLKPDGKTWYWEFNVTPRNRKTSYWFPGRGRLGLDSPLNYQGGLQVGAKNKGSLNNWKDKDEYWTGEMAIPVKDLITRGESFGPGTKWRVFVGRYNYSRYLTRVELSGFPKNPEMFHSYEYYAELDFENP